MATFRGNFDYKLDVKNRLTVPAKWRSSFSDGAVLAKGTAACLSVWVPEHFDAYVDSAVSRLHQVDAERDEMERYFHGNSHDVDLDAAGRIMIPGWLMEHASLTTDVVLTGVRKRVEIWDRETWKAYNATLNIAELTKRVSASSAGPTSA